MKLFPRIRVGRKYPLRLVTGLVKLYTLHTRVYITSQYARVYASPDRGKLSYKGVGFPNLKMGLLTTVQQL